MKYYELDKEEQELLKEYEGGKMRSVPNVKAKIRMYQRTATHALQKTRNINIRLSEQALHSIKVKAIEKGMPYQTLIASIIHQYSHGKVREEA